MSAPTPEQLQQEAEAAEAELATTTRRIEETEAAIEAGDDVPEDTISRIQQRAQHLKIKLRGLGRRREEALAARRLRELQALRKEIEAGIQSGTKEISAAGREAYNALVKFAEAITEHNTRQRGWSDQLRAYGCPGFGQAPSPSPDHAELGFAGGAIAIGRTRLAQLGVATAVDALADAAKLAERGRAPSPENVRMLAQLERSLIHTVPDPPADRRYFTHGGTHMAHSFDPETIERHPTILQGMTEISRAEWTAAQWRSAQPG